jgi:hypothetical protein
MIHAETSACTLVVVRVRRAFSEGNIELVGQPSNVSRWMVVFYEFTEALEEWSCQANVSSVQKRFYPAKLLLARVEKEDSDEKEENKRSDFPIWIGIFLFCAFLIFQMLTDFF